MEHEYVDDRNYISYSGDDGTMVFIRRCPECSRFVKANKEVRSNGNGLADEPNALCGTHRAIQMPFIGYM